MLLKYKIEFTDSQFKILSEISLDIAQIVFASVVVSPLLVGIDRINWLIVISGLLITLICWLFSIIIVKELKI